MLTLLHPHINDMQSISLEHFTDGTLKMRCRLPEALKYIDGLPLTIQWKYEAEEELS